MIPFFTGEFTSFSKYVELSEAISPIPTAYGTDIIKGKMPSNKKIILLNHEGNTTIMKHKSGYFNSTWVSINDEIYWIGFDNANEFVFALFTGDPKKEEDVLDLTKNYTMNRTNTMEAISVFGKIFYVIIELAKAKNLKYITFEGFDVPLDKFYSIMVKNKILLNALKTHGWEYTGKEDTHYIFSKISNI